ncbi:NADPH:quinone oxidoreductase family protein [Rhodococcus koreensis]|uniref:NADPH:quinone oxidoreductase family protein n=1 Tax=Rhodococcus koreensis TaxID=99653 RepID=UPI00197D41BE|nr:NADPH:quinone oxidoreductase family protein [Rhodococcus koreensis]QSE86930.1 NADPH:quinone oxidoreductase family protein [Rhodococcus koreensis]
MRSWHVQRHGDPRTALLLRDTEPPQPAPGQIRVRVGATSCNFADVLLCRGKYQAKPDLPFTPGLETCGVVDSVGDAAQADLLGARVVGQPVLPYGGFAEFAVMDSAAALTVPPGIPDASAATLHLTYLTAWLGLHRRGAMAAGDVVVITAAAGGVGFAAAQVAMAAGATVIGIVSGPEKKALLEAHGVPVVIDRTDGDVVERVRAESPRGGADIVFESVGGDAYQEATKYITFEGRIIVIGFAGGTIPQPRLTHAFIKNYTIAGLHWGLYWKHRPDVLHEAQSDIFELFRHRTITPLISRTIPIDDVADALQDLADGHTHGKSVMMP